MVHEEINSKMWYTLHNGVYHIFEFNFDWTEQKIVINPYKLIPN